MRVYVGMDVHRKRSQVALVDEHGGQLANRNLANSSAELVAVLGRLEPARRSRSRPPTAGLAG
jgi:hypothetical protein